MTSKIRICLLLVGFLALVLGKEAGAQSGSGYSLATSANTVAPGSTITVLWQAPSTHATRDWIGLFPVGLPNKSFIAWKSVPSGTSGTMTFTIPNTTTSQVYEFRYLLNDGYANIATSNSITITSAATPPAPTASSPIPSSTTQTQTSPPPSPPPPPSITYALTASPGALSPGGTVSVAWQAPSTHGTRDWVGLFLAGRPSAGNTVITWKYVPGGTSGIMTFAAPTLEPNQLYEFRYLLNDGYTKAATSNPIRAAVGTASPSPSPVIPSTTTGPSQSPSSTPASPPASTPTPSQTGSRSATLAWKPSISGDVEGYKIYRSTAPGAYGAAIATLSRSVTTYQATGLQLNTTYYFVVTAFDGSNNESLYSNEVSKSIY